MSSHESVQGGTLHLRAGSGEPGYNTKIEVLNRNYVFYFLFIFGRLNIIPFWNCAHHLGNSSVICSPAHLSCQKFHCELLTSPTEVTG